MTAATSSLRDRIATALELRMHYWRWRRENFLGQKAPQISERLYRAGDEVGAIPFRHERHVVPAPREVSGVMLDIVGDLQAFTQLDRVAIDRLVREREPVSFRTEWYSTPTALRGAHWFHLASKSYLFGNASHFQDTEFVDSFVAPHVGAGARVLDFGGGTGELSMQLAARRYQVFYLELNALQRDFLRFRSARHRLGDRLTVLDWWDDLPRDGFDAVIAVDVLEHVDDLPTLLDDKLLPAIAPRGVFVENSPFVINVANPMHHEDFGFEAHMERRGFTELARGDEGTRVWSRRDSG